MDRYGGGYLYKDYTANNGVRPAPFSGDWSKERNSPYARPDDRVRKSIFPGPVSGSTLSDGEVERKRGSFLPLLPHHNKESNLSGKNMVDMAYSTPLGKNTSPTKVDEPVKDFVETQQQTSQVHRKPQSFDDFIKKVHDDANGPHGSAVSGNYLQPPYSSAANGIPSRGDYGEREGYSPTANGASNDDYDEYRRKNDRPLQATAVNNGSWTRPIRPTWAAPQANGSPSTLGRPSYSPHFNGLTNPGAYDNYSQKDWQNPAGNMIRNGGHDNYYRQNESTGEPTSTLNGGWARPKHVARAPPPGPDNGSRFGEPNKRDWDTLNEPAKVTSSAAAPSAFSNGSKGYGGAYNDYNIREGNKPIGATYWNDSAVSGEPTPGNWNQKMRSGTQLSHPTSNIGEVVGILNNAAHTTAGFGAPRQPRYSVAAASKDSYPETISSSLDGMRRYGNFKFPSQQRNLN